jgi:GTP1/Obg family GTP-binding protein
MKNLGENAKQLSGVSDSVAATDSFVASLSKATESIRNVGASYDKTAEAIGENSKMTVDYFQKITRASEAVDRLASIYEESVQTMSVDTGYVEGANRLAKNLSAINAAYELQLQATTEALNTTRDLDEQMRISTEGLSQTVSQVLTYREQVDMLSQNVGKLNDIYGNMLAAMAMGR